jgi:hypothetical protein
LAAPLGLRYLEQLKTRQAFRILSVVEKESVQLLKDVWVKVLAYFVVVAQHFKVNYELLIGSATRQLPRDFSQSLFHVDHALQAAHPVNAFEFAYFQREIFGNLLQLYFYSCLIVSQHF